MYNLLSALLIIAAAATGFRQGFIPNQLYHLGLLLLMGYLSGLAAERIRLPAALGYIAAGILAGPVTGLIGDPFLDNTMNVYAFFLMLLLAGSASRMCRASGIQAIRFLLTGAAGSLLLFGITMLALTAVPISTVGRIGLALFAAISSPLLMDALYGDKADARHYLIAFGGLALSVTAWGFAIVFLGPDNPGRLRIAFMPSVIALTSALCGYALGFAAYALAEGKSLRPKGFYAAVALFIAYPLIGVLGLDYLFLAAGFGIFHGLVSTEEQDTGSSPLISILVFSVFGLTLKIDSMAVMNTAELKLVAILAVAILCGRALVFALASRVLQKTGEHSFSLTSLLTVGPLAMLLVIRFLPGLPLQAGEINDQFQLLRICTASIFIILIVTSIQTWITQLALFLINRRVSDENSA